MLSRLFRPAFNFRRDNLIILRLQHQRVASKVSDPNAEKSKDPRKRILKFDYDLRWSTYQP